MHQNGSTSIGADDQQGSPPPAPSRSKARNDARPYPALAPNASSTGSGPLRSSVRNNANKGPSSSGTNSPPSGLLLPPSTGDQDASPSQDANSPDSNDDSPPELSQSQYTTASAAHLKGTMAAMADVMPLLDDAMLLASNGNINPFYDMTENNTYSTAAIHNIPPVHQFVAPSSISNISPLPNVSPSQITTGSFTIDHHGLAILSQSNRLDGRGGGRGYSNRFGGTDPLESLALPWEVDDWDSDDDHNQLESQKSSLLPEQTMLGKEIDICRKACGVQTVDIASKFL